MQTKRRTDPDWRGHEEQIENLRNGLRDLSRRWDDDKCGPPPVWVPVALEQPILSYEDIRLLQVHQAQTAGMVAMPSGGGISGYLIYRALRIIPSLAPPLWWTIPENLVVR